MFKIIKVYLYNSEQRDEMFKLILNNLNKTPEYKRNYIIMKDWVFGRNIKIYVKEDCCNIDEFIRTHIERFEDKVVKEDYIKYKILSERLKVAERYNGEYLPLKDNLTIETYKTDLSEIDTVFSRETYLDIEVIKTNFLIEHSEILNLSDDEKELLLIKLMSILANSFDVEGLQGIRFGHISFKSHYEGFISQLNMVNEAYKEQARNKINKTAETTNNFIYHNFSSFIDQVNSNFNQYDEDDKSVLLDWKVIVDKLNIIFTEIISNNQLNLKDYHNMEAFLSTSNKLSKFHSELVNDDKFLGFSKTLGFKRYRLLINFLYSLFPLVNISPLQKNKLCKLVSEAVENSLDFSWKDANMLKHKYG